MTTSRSVSGIADIKDHRGFVRTDGYLPADGDAFLPPSLIDKYALRRGDLVTGTAGEAQGRKASPMTTVDTVNGVPVDQLGRDRPDFYAQTPIFPDERMRLETDPRLLATRVIDLVSPIGKGQRALIVSPPKAGKTTVLQAVAKGISENHPDAYLMALLVDERPEEVTDMRRTVRGEVVASPFDRPPSDHIAVAELAVERAKRLVEAGADVVLLLDSITRLGRAYNLAAPSSGRIMSGGIEAGALHAPKRFLGAARNLEGGGSLTIVATALVETGSLADTVIFEEFKSTGNSEVRLLRGLAERRIFPAVDVDASGTRREELLFTPAELELVRRLRRALSAADSQHAGEQLVERLAKTSSNAEFLMQLARA
ncbi:transcription termination factor Rho [Hamadaea tsunoensis]|uniref:transcription termination factor Rho n=1 Tax=Hamadaea tsunoensis TaxID=53368 RepID=UPI0003FB33F1|nr:transcription termination factor Rho [Hamadaea tsunoensis]